MPRWVWYVATGLAVLGIAAKVRAAELLGLMTRSSAATEKGLDNEPSSPEARKRLLWLAGRRVEMLRVLRGKWADAEMTSAYRNDKVNAAVGGVPTSRHRLGLALDFGWPGGNAGAYVEAQEYVRAHLAELPVKPRYVYAEVYTSGIAPHLHVEYFDPLGIADPPGAQASIATRFQADSAPA